MFDIETLSALRDALDLYLVACEIGLDLKKEGAVWRALCPFHNERTPSFTIGKNSKFFKCFGCGVTGDAISLVRHVKGWSFVDTIEFLSGKFGVPISYKKDKEHQGQHGLFVKAIKAVHEFSLQNLCSVPNNVGFKYLLQRGVSLEMIKHFELGFVSDDATLITHIERFMKECKMVGLLTYYNRYTFYGRVTFPLTNAAGVVLGFSGRAISNVVCHKPVSKYINSMDSFLLNKSKAWFGMHLVRSHIVKSKTAVLVEGFFDFIMCFSNGICNVICTQGVNMGDHMTEVLLEWGVQTIYVAFDGDTAGQNAALLVGKKLIQKMVDVYVVMLPKDKDPDLFIRENNAEAMVQQIKDALPLHRFWARWLTDTYKDKRTLLTALQASIKEISEFDIPYVGSEQESFLALFCASVGVQFDTKENLLIRWKIKHTPVVGPLSTSRLKDNKHKQAIYTAITQCLRLCLESPESAKQLLSNADVLFLWQQFPVIIDNIPENLCKTWMAISNITCANISTEIDADTLLYIMNTPVYNHNIKELLRDMVQYAVLTASQQSSNVPSTLVKQIILCAANLSNIL